MKAYVQMDYLQNLGTDYLSASYRDFVPEPKELKGLIKGHLKAVVNRAERIKEITRGIANLEAIATQPIRSFIEYQIQEGIKATPSYFTLRERGLHVRKQTFLQYYNAVKEGWREEKLEVEEEYDETALNTIHDWLTKELQRAFSGWSIEEDYEINETDKFTASYKTRTFEFGLIRTARVNPEEVSSEETYYFIVYNKGAVQAYDMWKAHVNPITGKRSGVEFDYMGFNREMRRIGAWKE